MRLSGKAGEQKCCRDIADYLAGEQSGQILSAGQQGTERPVDGTDSGEISGENEKCHKGQQ